MSEMMNKKRLITSALPYVNNVPHLGNLIQVLSADVYARFCRSRGYETVYICGTDEYGTATETKAREQKVSPQELCSRYFAIHRDIYQWFCISFDMFGRTSTSEQTAIVQDIFLKLYHAGFIEKQTVQQYYSEVSKMFLADRYILGICPHCDYEYARGDQCENCGTLLDPTQLKNPISKIDNTAPILKETTHLYINLPKILPKLEGWLESVKHNWSKNAIRMTEAWIRDGLKPRAITRDLQWGIPVPLEEFTDKVFYVWFDAPIGYISITATHTQEWEKWWKNPEQVELVQFIGKDNIPFHTVMFPCSLLGASQTKESEWTLLHQISSSEYLNYEGGAFSKSRGVGVFGNDVMDIGLPSDMWRFYLFYNRPENSDFMFTWKDFQDSVNGELINNLANLYHRTLSFQCKYFGNTLVQEEYFGEETEKIWKDIKEREDTITHYLEKTELRSAYRSIFALSDYGNKLFQDMEPWNLRKQDTQKTQWLIRNLIYLLRDIAILIEPFTPIMSHSMLSCLYPHSFNRKVVSDRSDDTNNTHFYTKNYTTFNWSMLGTLKGIHTLTSPTHLFARLEDSVIQELSVKYHGKQENFAMNVSETSLGENNKDTQELSLAQQFAQKVELRVVKILTVEVHPDADKLYILRLDDGSEEGRTIVSSIRPYYTEEELVGRHILIVANLKPAKFRGVPSKGMLLATDPIKEHNDAIELLFADECEVATQVLPENCTAPQEYTKLKIDTFANFSLKVVSHVFMLGDNTSLKAGEKNIHTKIIADANVH